MKSKGLTIGIIVAVVIGLIWLKPSSKGSEKANASSGAKTQPILVNGYIVKAEDLKNVINITGNIMANQDVELHSEASGKVTDILFKEGSNVSKGQLLVKINDRDLRAQLKKSTLMQNLAEQKYERQKHLFEAGAISKEEFEIILSDLSAFKADVELIQANIAKLEIRAPFSGKIGLKSINIGSYLTPGTSIAKLQDISPVKIDFTIPEKHLQYVKVGNTIQFAIAGSEKLYKGSIYAIEPQINTVSRGIQVRAICDNSDEDILPGAFAQILLQLKDIKQALLIPTEAVIPELKGQKVYIAQNGKAAARKIVTGIRTDNRIQITNGLSIGDTLITTGIMQIKPDSPVKITIQ